MTAPTIPGLILICLALAHGRLTHLPLSNYIERGAPPALSLRLPLRFCLTCVSLSGPLSATKSKTAPPASPKVPAADEPAAITTDAQSTTAVAVTAAVSVVLRTAATPGIPQRSTNTTAVSPPPEDLQHSRSTCLHTACLVTLNDHTERREGSVASFLPLAAHAPSPPSSVSCPNPSARHRPPQIAALQPNNLPKAHSINPDAEAAATQRAAKEGPQQ